MSFGIVLKGSNALHFGSKVDFFFEFIPQLIMLLALFGFMDAMIVKKWLTDFTNIEYTAPSIITNMIDMCLNGGVQSVPTEASLFGSAATQTQIMNTLLMTALVCVPLMLFVKPIYVKTTHSTSTVETEVSNANPEIQHNIQDDYFKPSESVISLKHDEDIFHLHSLIL